MAAADNTHGVHKDWQKRESFVSALVQVAIVGILLAGAVYFFVQRGQTRKAVAEKMKEARATALRDNPADLRKALTTLDEVFQLDDDAPDALALAADIHGELWMAHREAAHEAKARDYLAKAVAADSKSEERFGTEALLKLAAGDAQGADSFVDELRKKGANSARLLYAAARASQTMGKLALSREAYRQAADRAWKDPRFNLAYGEQLLEEGQYVQAAETLEKALKANGDHLQASLMRGLVDIYRGQRVPQVADVATEVLSRGENELTPAVRALATTVKAEVALSEGRTDEAQQLAEQAIALDGENHYALYAKARALAVKKDAGAAAAFQAAAAKRKTAPFIYFGGASALLETGNLEGARALLDSYEATFKNVRLATIGGEEEVALERDDRYWLARGDLLRQSEDAQGAMAAYDKAIAAKSFNQARAHYAKGSLLLSQKEYAKAKEVLSLVTPEDGTGSVPEAYVAMGDIAFQDKDWATGAAYYGFALSRFRGQGATMAQLDALRVDVEKKLKTAGQAPVAKAWMEESKALLQ